MRFVHYCLFLGLFACQSGTKPPAQSTQPPQGGNTFGDDVAFLRRQPGDVILLQHAADSGMVAVTGSYQARVMTSSANGLAGKSYGWLNYQLISSGKYNPHINAYGGEERFWLGPEGGQYGLFFPSGKPMNFDTWQTPGLIDTAVFQLRDQSGDAVTYVKEGTLTNYAGTTFNVGITRSIRLLEKETLPAQLHIDLPAGVKAVAYQTENTLVNKGSKAWQESTGLLSIWLLGMYTPSDKTMIVVPFKGGPDAHAGIHDDYFGKIPPDYLQVKDSILLMKADGRHRGKIGLAPEVALPMSGSVDTESGAITLILFSIQPGGRYVNSKWEQQKEPYKGDVANCYNDGPLADGTQMGPFYELESSSAARPLAPGDSMVYRQTTVHLEGEKAVMDSLAQQLFKRSISEIAGMK
ncbi:hypothetical protein F0L74_21080 [Chitinophaga agrisoli]|uniref:Methane monooxygenase PmoA-like n=1 Tax=Chitinophaga agrisoli TaxID=2607653 RepID=A0A5B2VIG3_9BACT|nr:DUF6786 family protein [Chitinophaga agrisoli]KAA2238714.1 hypothetical protein F0L74_21080 [Chitinophaga agrisoli]